MNNFVSVIMPTYNSSDFIRQAILSVLNQSHRDLEVIVVDDGSTLDGAAKIVKQLSEQDSRVRYFRQENAGQAAARNLGVAKAAGDFIALLDDDDEWIDKDKLKKQIEFLQQNPESVLLGTGMHGVDASDKNAYDYIPPLSDIEIRKNILFGSCFINSSVMFTKQVFQKVDGYKAGAQMRHVEDYELWLNLGTVGKMANLDFYGVKCRLRPSSDGGKNLLTQQVKNIALIKTYRKFYPKYYQALMFAYARLIIRKLIGNVPIRPVLKKIFS
jgi:glycosyltransferase involved in cell wall biosynthesis